MRVVRCLPLLLTALLFPLHTVSGGACHSCRIDNSGITHSYVTCNPGETTVECDFGQGQRCYTHVISKQRGPALEKGCYTDATKLELCNRGKPVTPSGTSAEAKWWACDSNESLYPECIFCCEGDKCNIDQEADENNTYHEPNCRVGERQIGDQCVYLRVQYPSPETKDQTRNWCVESGRGYDGIFAPKTVQENGLLKDWIFEWFEAGGGDYNIWLDYVTGSGTDLSIKTSAGTTLAFAADWDKSYTQTVIPNECIYIGQAGWRKASCDIPITAGAACSTSLRTVNGKWKDWSGWTACSPDCGDTATKTRNRECELPKYGGASCSGNDTESIGCDIGSCPEYNNPDGGLISSKDYPNNYPAGYRSIWYINLTVAYGVKIIVKESTIDDNNDNCDESAVLQIYDNDTAENALHDYCGSDKTEWVIESNFVKISFDDKDSVSQGKWKLRWFGFIDGAWGDWTDWTNCTAECEKGHKNRTRSCDNPAPFNGLKCNGTSQSQESCNEHPCPIDGNWTEWANNGLCNVTCGGGIQQRIRNCTNPPAQHHGLNCSGSDEDQLPCNVFPCPINGNWTLWSDWNMCTSTCGGGSYDRNRTCTEPEPEHGGENCTGYDWEEQTCNSQPCPIDGNWTVWTDWEICSSSCGGGNQSRYRECSDPTPEYEGLNCTGADTQNQTCNTDPCPIDGKWTRWSPWGACDVSCDGGSKSRFRSCADPRPLHGGIDCSGKNTEVIKCNTAVCAVNGGWSSWSSWRPCSVTCGSGLRKRMRDCNDPLPANGGSPCSGDDQQYMKCEEEECYSRAPYFEYEYEVELYEEQASGTSVVNLTAYDKDQGDNGVFTMSLAEDDIVSGDFSLNGVTGELITSAVLDREANEFHKLTVYATDKADTPLTGSTIVLIHILDINDNIPEITNKPFTGVIMECDQPKTRILQIHAKDSDLGANSELTYTILNSSARNAFKINADTGVLSSAAELDYEKKQSHSMTIKVSDSGTPQLSSTTSVTVDVLDCNDNRPLFEKKDYTFELADNERVGSIVGYVKAADADSQSQLTYRITNIYKGAPLFSVLPNGAIVLSFPVGNAMMAYQFTVQATDSDINKQLSSTVNVTIIIIDSKPRFQKDSYLAAVDENAPVGTEVMKVEARVSEEMEGVELTYGLVSSLNSASGELAVNKYLHIHPQTGVISIKELVDREQFTELLFKVIVINGGVLAKSHSVPARIKINDLNDNTPVLYPLFYNTEIAIPANSGQPLVTLKATDPDSGDNGAISYSLVNHNDLFSIDETTGELTKRTSQPLIAGEKMILKVKASDNGNPRRVSINQARVRVDVFNPVKYMVYIDISSSESAGELNISAFAKTLQDDMKALSLPIKIVVHSSEKQELSGLAKRETSTRVWIYGYYDTDDMSAIDQTKEFISAAELTDAVKRSTVVRQWSVDHIGDRTNELIEPVAAKALESSEDTQPTKKKGSNTVLIVLGVLCGLLFVAVVLIITYQSEFRKRFTSSVRPQR